MYNKMKLMQIANTLFTGGMTRSEALKEAWAVIKGQNIKVSGVTFGKRQRAIERLNKYAAERVSYSLERDYSNPYDSSAIAVVASVAEKGSFTVGYVPAEISKMIGPLIDRKIDFATRGRVISGGIGFNYGLRLNIAV